MLRHWFLYYGKIFLVSLSTLSSLAASELQNLNRQPFFEFFNPDDIPAHEQNWAIDFDQLGRVYVANTNGMLMFDGVRWKGFSTTKLGITRAIVVKDSDKIFVGGQNALGFFEAQPDGTWQFKNISIPVELGNVGAIWQGILLNDDIYFASDNYLIKIDSNQSVTARKSKGRVSVGQSGNFSWAFVPGDGLYDLSKSFQHAAFKNTKVRIMGVHKSADSWLVIYRNGKLALIQSDNLYHPNNRTYIKNKALKDQVVTSVSEVPGGTAVTTANNGLVLLNESGQTVKHINVFDSWVLNSNYFNGNLWIAQDGAIIRMPWPITFERIMDESGMGHVLESITQYNNEIYVGSTKGLFKFDKNLRLFTPVHLSNQPSTVWELEPTVAGLLAITDYGTYLLKNKTASLVIAGHTRGFVALQEPKNHYLVTSHLNGTYLLKANLNGIKVAASDPALQLNSSNIIQSADGSIFVDTRKNGVYRIRLKTDLSMQVDHLNLNQLAVGMESKETNTMEPNTSVFLMDNIPIVNSFGRFCRPEFDTLKKCILENRFVQDYGDQSFETKQHDGTLYFDGHEGYMYQIKPDKFGKYARQYSNMDELGNSNLTDLLEFGTETLLTRHDGLWVMHPDRLKSSLLPKVWISDINIGTEWPYQAATLLQKIPTVISANLDRIRFYFDTDTRAASKYHLWRTKLEGYNNEYSEWSNQSWQDFTRLSGGDYKLLIQLKIRSGRVSTPYSLNFSVAYPWYLSTLAKVIYTFTIVGLLILFTVMYSRRKNRLLLLRQTELESQVSQRTTELQINQRELTAQARKLVELDKAKSRFFANITHEFRTPLTLMIGPLTDLVKGRFGQLVPAQKKPINLAINRSSGLLELIEELLDVSRLDAGVLVLNAQKVNVIELVKNALAQLDPMVI